MSNTTKIIIIGLIAMFLGIGYILRGTTPDTELRNVTAIRTAEVEREMKAECAKAFEQNGEQLNKKCNDLIDDLYERGFEVIKYEDGTFEMRLDV